MINRIGYLLPHVILLYLLLSISTGALIQTANPYLAGRIFILSLLYTGAIDWVLGRSVNNSYHYQSRAKAHVWATRLILWSTLPLIAALLFLVMDTISSKESINNFHFFGLILLCGLVSTIICFIVGHELIHRASKLDQIIGGLLLCLVCYPSFKIEHRRSHHRWVGTANDASSAKKGQNLYYFLPRAIILNTREAWALENQRLKNKMGLKKIIHHEMVYWAIINTVLLLVAFILFGWLGLAFFVLQSLVAIIFLETINYIQHYGLRRKQDKGGKFEAVGYRHSWNAPHWYSKWALFNLMSHSDHHVHQFQPFWALQTTNFFPQLPFPTPLAVIIAFVPPLWRWIMDPLVDFYQHPDIEKLST